MAMLEAALKYAQNGFRVLPLRPKGKEPLIKGWVKKASTDKEKIQTWWEDNSDINIGLLTGHNSGFFVVDIDGPKGEQSLSEFEAEHGKLPKTLEQKTGREGGGRHLFFKTPTVLPWEPDKKRVGCRTSVLPGVDVKGEGGYVVAPPSIHPDTGQQYSWVNGPDVLIVKAPQALLQLIEKKPSKAQDQEKQLDSQPVEPRLPDNDITDRARLYLAKCDPAVQGEAGHGKLLWAAQVLVRGFKLDDNTALSLLWAEFNPRCNPPWDAGDPADVKDFERKVTEARKLPSEKPDGWLLNDYGLQPLTDEEMAIAREQMSQGLLSGVEKKLQPEFGEFEVRTLADLKTPPDDDPQELLRYGFLRRGGGGLIVGPTGVGKSSLIMQMALCWTSGKPACGIEPHGPLNILIIQAENDDGDLAEMRDGVLAGMILENIFTEEDAVRAAASVKIVSEETVTGNQVGDLIQKCAKNDIDLVILDPAFAYLGGDSLKAQDVSHFLRKVITPVLKKLNIGILIVHHTNKPQQNLYGQKQIQDGEYAYKGAGSAEWGNWPRCVITLRPVGSIYELREGKRWRRLRWEDNNGKKIAYRYIGHSDHGICWREASNEEILQVVSSSSTGKDKTTWRDFEELAIELLKSKVWKVKLFEKELLEKFGLPAKGVRDLRQYLENQPEFLHARGPNEGETPIYLIGEKEAVTAEVERLKDEKNQGRDGKNKVPAKVLGDVIGEVKGTPVEEIGDVV